MIPKEILELRKDPKNYRYKGLIYHCSEDPSIIVPKRWAWMGWTFNFAHPKVWQMFFYSIFATVVPIIFLIYLTEKNEWPLMVLIAGMASHIILICLWCHKEATASF